MRYSIIPMLLVAACSRSPPPGAAALAEVPVESWQYVEVAPLDSSIEAALAAGEQWPESPARVALEVLGGESEARSLSLTEEKVRAEAADTVIVVLARDGFLDDSVRGDWHRLVLYRSADGGWRVADARRALRCWRADADHYRAGPCP